MLDIAKFNNSIVITLDELSSYILSIKQKTPKVNFKLITMSKAQEMAFGNFIIPNAYQVGLSINHNYIIVKKIISYLQKGINPITTKTINEIWNLLNKNNLIITSENYKFLFKNKNIFIVGLDKNNNELKHLIEKLEINPNQISYISINELFPEIKVPVVKYPNVAFEVKDTLYKVIDLLQNKKVDPSNIIICSNNDETNFYLKLFADELKINLHFWQNETLFDTAIAKEIYNQIENIKNIKSFDKFASLDEKANNLIKQVFIDYNLFNIKKDILKLNYVAILKDIPYSVNGQDDKQGINVFGFKYFDPYKYIFYLSLTDTNYTTVYKDNDYLPNKVKHDNCLQSLNSLNETSFNLSKAFLNLSNTIYLSYAVYSNNGIEKLSYFYENKKNENKQIVDYQNDYVEYSDTIAKLWLSYYLKTSMVFHTNKQEKDVYSKYFDNKITYYDNNFKNFGQIPLPNSSNKISYSLINGYFECPFKYFCEQILQIKDKSENTNTKIGSFVHSIISQIQYTNDFAEALAKAKQHKESKYSLLDKWELIYVDRYINLIHQVWNRLSNKIYEIKKANKTTIDIECEKLFLVPFKDTKYIIASKIDCILKSKGQNNTLLQIIDYKTGNNKPDTLTNLEYGINLQLPIYAYVLEQDNRYKNSFISGLYYQFLNPKNNVRNWNDLTTNSELTNLTAELINEQFKLYGKTLNKHFGDKENLEWIEQYKTFFDPCLTDIKNSKYLTINPNKNSNQIFKSINEETQLVEKFITYFIENAINSGKMNISPYYVSSSTKTACEHCKYKDICFFDSITNAPRIKKQLGECLEIQKEVK